MTASHIALRFMPAVALFAWAIATAVAPESTLVAIIFIALVGICYAVAQLEVREWRACMRRLGRWPE